MTNISTKEIISKFHIIYKLYPVFIFIKYIYFYKLYSIYREIVSPLKYTDYLKRVHSFQACYWFAKPAIISPLICAQYGWINSGVNKISCSFCKIDLNHDDCVSKNLYQN